MLKSLVLQSIEVVGGTGGPCEVLATLHVDSLIALDLRGNNLQGEDLQHMQTAVFSSLEFMYLDGNAMLLRGEDGQGVKPAAVRALSNLLACARLRYFTMDFHVNEIWLVSDISMFQAGIDFQSRYYHTVTGVFDSPSPTYARVRGEGF
jgi:hypothetical protein